MGEKKSKGKKKRTTITTNAAKSNNKGGKRERREDKRPSNIFNAPGNKITQPSLLHNRLPLLTTLDLHGNGVFGLAGLSSLVSLTTLYIVRFTVKRIRECQH